MGGVAFEFVPDADGAVARVKRNTALHRFYHYDGPEIIVEYDGTVPVTPSGDLLRRYVRGPGVDEAFLMIDVSGASATETWALANRIGSTVLTTDENGAVIDKIAYSPYGEPSVTTGFPFKFTGQRYDAQVGLHYYKMRWYASGPGRFLQTDPVGFEDQMNLYAYVANDPVNNTDPTGEILNALGGIVNAGIEGVIIGAQIASGQEISAGEALGRVAVAGVSGALGVGLAQRVTKGVQAASALRGASKAGSAFRGGAAGGATVGSITSAADELGDAAISGDAISLENVAISTVVGAGTGGTANALKSGIKDLVATRQVSAGQGKSASAQVEVLAEASSSGPRIVEEVLNEDGN